ncbi:N-formylglutamate amidohydrolase [Pseudochrobactrum sp. sp1633]|uniref:N-formylglutamate amidohydrolase n=1 Tax=Pseudochrobactrum sp. sp1633 TaxID=3036706 RepID=UPI0025A55820|nr:N-formylglutamate amidohydrolase [Pseudochrobactrum sp. sp1633]MDM8344091.1 N-formylglutamate amidohydrolase [Pseudochrobactrum sp. sp1633]HWD12065.1 N-formylglutamate amidohydrolase [Pseudochrobactrum sp.]
MVEKRDSSCDVLHAHAANPDGDRAAVSVVNEQGSSPYLLICEHATNYMPEKFSRLGLSDADLAAHIAWDPGAAEVARRISKALDATLVEAGLSRLLIDCNRPLSAPDLIPTISEFTVIPGNHNLSEAERQERIALSHKPFHDKIEVVIEARKKRGQESRLITIHSYTPVYKGVGRPWEIGIIHDADDRLGARMIAALRKNGESSGINVGVNEPYSPDDLVYYTVERHARNRGDLCAMVEIRNNEIADDEGQALWAARLSSILQEIEIT